MTTGRINQVTCRKNKRTSSKHASAYPDNTRVFWIKLSYPSLSGTDNALFDSPRTIRQPTTLPVRVLNSVVKREFGARRTKPIKEQNTVLLPPSPHCWSTDGVLLSGSSEAVREGTPPVEQATAATEEPKFSKRTFTLL